MAAANVAPSLVDPEVLRRKIGRHVLPFIFLLYIVSYLDRANAGFAKLAMADDLKFSDAVFGLGFGLFFIGYLFLEIPGALLVERWSARKWFARILISWGFASALTAFVRTPMEFYIARFILGVAEAGFFPGVIVYFTHWFTSQDRARALAGLVMAIPFCLALGAPLSAILLKINWLGLIGWKWLFLLEGLPAVALGIATLFVLDDRPRDAKWLEPHERDWLCNQLDAEARAKDAIGKTTYWQALRLRNVWLLTLGIFTTNTGGYALTFWLPTAVKSISGGSTSYALWWIGAIYAFGILGVYVSGQSSDRTGDRKWHCVAGQCVTGLFLAASAVPGQPFWLVMTWLCLTGLTASSWPSPFWALPTMTLTASVAAASIGFINIFANLAGFLGNYNVGMLEAHGVGQRGCLLFLAGCYLLGGIFVSFVRVPAGPNSRRESV